MLVQLICITTLQRLDYNFGYTYEFARAVTFGWKKDNIPLAQPDEELPEATMVDDGEVPEDTTLDDEEIPVAPAITLTEV